MDKGQLFIAKLDAFSRPKMLFGYANEDKIEVRYKDTTQFISRSDAFTLLKLFLQLQVEELESELRVLEQQAVNVRDNLVRAGALLTQLPHKQLGDGFELLARIVNNDTQKPDWAI